MTTYEEETTIAYISFRIYRNQTVDAILFCIGTGAAHSYIGDKALERIFCLPVHRTIPGKDFKRDFIFNGSFTRLIEMVELTLPTLQSTLDVFLLLDLVYVEIPTLLRHNDRDGNNSLIANAANHL